MLYVFMLKPSVYRIPRVALNIMSIHVERNGGNIGGWMAEQKESQRG